MAIKNQRQHKPHHKGYDQYRRQLRPWAGLGQGLFRLIGKDAPHIDPQARNGAGSRGQQHGAAMQFVYIMRPFGGLGGGRLAKVRGYYPSGQAVQLDHLHVAKPGCAATKGAIAPQPDADGHFLLIGAGLAHQLHLLPAIAGAYHGF